MAAVTAGWFAYISLSGLSKGKSELRDLEDFLADALGAKYPPQRQRAEEMEDE